MSRPDYVPDYGNGWKEEIEKVFVEPDGLSSELDKQSRILVVGTNAEVRELRESGLEARYDGRRVDYCSVVYNFWKKFLASEDINDPTTFSLPERVISTGYMRAYEYFSETAYVKDHLRRIVQKANVDFEEIPAFNI